MTDVGSAWQEMCLRLALERQTGMPRWRVRPETPVVDAPNLIAARRQVLADIEPDTRPRHLRRIA